MTHEEQIAKWADGESIHDGACTPDFSCCKPELAVDMAIRRKFQQASKGERVQMLGMFLGAAIQLASAESGKKVYLAGMEDGRPTN